MRRLYRAVAIPKFTYAADIWFTPLHWKEGQKRLMGSVGVARKLSSLQCIATIAITGAMKTTATDVLEVHADLQPIDILLHDICHRATLRLASLPATHLLHKPIRTCARHLVKHHPSPLHSLFHTFSIKADTLETITPALQCPNEPNTFTTEIAETRDDSKRDDIEDDSNVRIYTDGSGADKQAGAGAVLYRNDQLLSSLRYCLGPLDRHTTYDAEGIGVVLALELLQRERGVRKATIRLDNQGVIQSIEHIRS